MFPSTHVSGMAHEQHNTQRIMYHPKRNMHICRFLDI